MVRYVEIDILKGIAVICMVLFHIFYYANNFGYKEFNYNSISFNSLAKIAQIIFIICVGINLALAKKASDYKKESKEDYILKSIKRILKLAFYAISMSIFTYIVFGDNYIKFGILHFIALSSLITFMFVDKERIIHIILFILIIFFIIKKVYPYLLINIFPKPIGFILGLNNNYNSLDHFPIIPWMILICIGIIIGNYLFKKKIKSLTIKNKLSQSLESLGKHSLEIYIIHWLVLYYIFSYIYPKIRKKII